MKKLSLLILISIMFSNCQETVRPAVTYCTLSGDAPLIIAHRGASGFLPEHTIAAYEMAIDQGADYIEPDLVITKDGHLIARHGRGLASTTNVADHPEFSDRKKFDHDHSEAEDWYAEDFTLAEIKTLRARQFWDNRPSEFDGQFEIPTFDEVLELAQSKSKAMARRIGIYPETKDPTRYRFMDLSFDEPLLASLKAYGYDSADDPVFIQSFFPQILERLAEKTDIKLVFLIEDVSDKAAFLKFAEVVDGVGPYKKSLLRDDLQSSGFIEAAHAAGLFVHIWTFRNDGIDSRFSDIHAETQRYFDLGIDGGFFDFPATGKKSLAEYPGCPKD